MREAIFKLLPVGSFSSGRIISHWSVGAGRTTTVLGHTSLSISDDGSRVVVSVEPNGTNYSMPTNFRSIRLYDTTTGREVKSIRTPSSIGPIVLMPDGDVVGARIDPPSLLAKKACIEVWNLNAGLRRNQLCSSRRDVVGVLAVTPTASRVVGFAAHIHKNIERNVSAVSGRVEVWDLNSGDVVALSEEMRGVPAVQVTPNGEWILAGQTLFHLGSAL